MAKEKYHFIFTPADGNAALPVAVGENDGGHFIPVAEGSAHKVKTEVLSFGEGVRRDECDC